MNLDEMGTLRLRLETRVRELRSAGTERALMEVLQADDPLAAIHELALADLEMPILRRAIAKLEAMEREARETMRYHERQKIPRPRGVVTSGR